jgi:signal transduction histidine kinase
MRIAARLNPVELPRTILLSTYTAAAPIVLIFIAFGAYWIAGRSLRPIARLTAVASAITAQKPGVRLPSVKSEDEVGSLTRVLNRMLERLEASYLQATRFSADASHELRTPLTVIRGEIENRLRKGNLPRDIEDLLVSLMEEAQRLEGITEGLLTLSQADAGNLQLEHERVSLSALIRLVIEDLEILASAQSVQVTADVADDIFVSANAKFLHQMLMNLGENAVKHNRPGGRIAVVLHSDANSIVVSISNTGEPIPKESQGSIFRRFYRSDRSRSRQVPGYGLGLSICWEIAHAHGWDLGLIRSDAEWTTFAVRIPKTVPGTPHSGRTATRHPVGHLPSATTRIVTTPKTGTKRDEKP